MTARLRAAGLLAAAALAAEASAQAPADYAMSATPAAKYWLRMYPLQPYSEYWRLALRVESLNKALPKVQAVLGKNGGVPTLPLANLASSPRERVQQLSYRIPAKSAGKALRALQAMGVVASLVKNPGAPPAVLEETKEKLARLRAETSANAEALARMPAVSALAFELIEHLSLVQEVHREAKERILLNLEIREGAAPR